MNINDIWTKTLAQIEVKLDSHAQFKTWFKDTKLRDIEGRYAIIQVKNPYTSDWLRNRHEQLITDTISYVAGKELQIKFEVNGNVIEETQPKVRQEVIEETPLFYQNNTVDINIQKLAKQAGLNEKFEMETYIVGTANRMAHAAALAVIDNPGNVYNPLFIYGPTGVGKTHLAQAIGHELLKNNPNRKVTYNASEGFLNDLIRAIQKGETRDFRQKYRKIDCLVIDDIQYISTWEKTQDEFFNTFNELYNANKQIIFISDRKPEEIKSIDNRLRTRFMGGLVVDITKPDFAMRMAVIKQQIHEKNMQLNQQTTEFLANSITDSIRELEGAIQKVFLYKDLKTDGAPLTAKEIARITGFDAKTKREKISLPSILKHIAKEFHVTVKDIKGERRTADVALARQVAMYVLREEYEYKLEKIAKILERKDHTTIIHGIDKIKSKIALSQGFAEQIIRLKDLIRNSSD